MAAAAVQHRRRAPGAEVAAAGVETVRWGGGGGFGEWESEVRACSLGLRV